MSNKIAILIAVVLGVVAAFAANSWMEGEKKKQEARYYTVDIIVAKKTLQPGDAIRYGVGKLGVAQIPKQMIMTGMITLDQKNRYRGYLVKERIDAGQPVTRDKLDPPYEKADTQASVVDNGMRAVTIAVDMISGVAGLIRPGDRVDLISTFDLSRTLSSGKSRNQGIVTLYLLQNVRVIALDNRTEKVSIARSKIRRNRQYRSVTLEVKPIDALRIINAQEQGRVRLMLRNRTDVAIQPQEKAGAPIGVNVVTNELKQVTPHTSIK